MAKTTDQLLSAVCDRCFWPKNATTGLPENAPLTTAQMMTIADEEIAGVLYPLVIAAHADYYSAILDQAVTNLIDQYRLPKNAYGPLKDVSIVDVTDNEYSVSLIDAEDLGHRIFSPSYYGRFNSGGLSFSMFFQGDFLKLRPVPAATINTLRIRYYAQPSKLCLVAETTTVDNVDATVNQVGLRAMPAAFTAAFTGDPGDAHFDIIVAGNAHQTIISNIDATHGSTTLFFDTTAKGFQFVVGDVGGPGGDYVALTGFTPVVQLPDFMITGAVRRVAAACLEAHKDYQAADRERGAADELLQLAVETAIPRTEGEPTLLTTPNSPFRVGRW